MFKTAGKFASAHELYDAIAKGEGYEVDSNGFAVPVARSIDNYGIDFRSLMRFVAIPRASVWTGGCLNEYRERILSDSFFPKERRLQPFDFYFADGVLR